MRVFVTGGAGFIGSHTLIELLRNQHSVCVFDNFSNSSPEALRRVRQLSNSDFEQVEGDIVDRASLAKAMQEFQPEAVIHFAGAKAVGESVEKPLSYYRNNVEGSISLLEQMNKIDCRRIVFSSSATVYGSPQYLPIDEKHPTSPTNPYGWTKLFVEQIIADWAKATTGAIAFSLRYFNPVGAHESGRIGEDPNDTPNNLMPIITQTAVGRRSHVAVFGDDYPTRDGTGERDYIHVTDLARAHLAALNALDRIEGHDIVNIGTGSGVTVLEMIEAFSKESGQKIPFNIGDRRPGDVSSCVAQADKAQRVLNWSAEKGLSEICKSAWDWQRENPDGYAKPK